VPATLTAAAAGRSEADASRLMPDEAALHTRCGRSARHFPKAAGGRNATHAAGLRPVLFPPLVDDRANDRLRFAARGAIGFPTVFPFGR
jgi:hypothetical protein